LDVRISERPACSVISSYRSSAWAALSSRMPKSSTYLAFEQKFAMFRQVGALRTCPQRGRCRVRQGCPAGHVPGVFWGVAACGCR
jgi:hypothetical protein